MRVITVRRKPYYRKPYTRNGGTRVKGAHVRGSTFRVKDRGRPGRGPKLIPIRNAREQKRHYGRIHPMNSLAKDMGYASATRVPDNKIDEFVTKLVNRYTERSARGMIQAQINFRANSHNSSKVIRDREKFKAMLASLDRQFMGGGWQK
jgi:hypothetical protein